LIDSVILPHQWILDALKPMGEALRGPDYQAAYQQVLLAICIPTDAEKGKHNSSLLCRRLPNMLSPLRSRII
jgi:hypothetical protein